MNHYPKYNKCKDCGQIEPESSSSIEKNEIARCIYCKSPKYEIWPSQEIEDLFDFIISYDEKQAQYSQVVPIFLCSTLELMLENLISVMAFMDLSYHDGFVLVDALIDSHQGRNRMLELYKRVSIGSFHSEVKDIGFKDFNKKWGNIVQTRNKIVHGKFKDTPKLIRNSLIDFIRESLEVFRLLHNKYNRKSLQYDIATKPREKRIDEELRKMILDKGFTQ